ncbi:hypothetical protein QU38_00535, partial [Staphylococcus aureus]
TAENETLAGQPGFGPRDPPRHRFQARIRLIAAGQIGDPFGDALARAGMNHDLVGNQIIDRRGARSAGIAEIPSLHGRSPLGKDAEAAILGIALQVDRDVDLAFAGNLRDGCIFLQPNIDKGVEPLLDSGTPG